MRFITFAAAAITTLTAAAGIGPRYEVVTKLQVLRCGQSSRQAVQLLVWSELQADEIARIGDDVWRERLAEGVVVQGYVLGRREVLWSLMPLVTGKDEPPSVTDWQVPKVRPFETFFYTGATQCHQITFRQVLITSSWSDMCDTCYDPFDWNRFLHELPKDTAEFVSAADRRVLNHKTKR